MSSIDERIECKVISVKVGFKGKWHLGHYCPQCLPQKRGFDTFYGYLTGAEVSYHRNNLCLRKNDAINIAKNIIV